jgi:hypothetical protein
MLLGSKATASKTSIFPLERERSAVTSKSRIRIRSAGE